MVAPFTDLWDGDAEKLIYLVLSGFTIRPTLPASLLHSIHSASRVGRLLAVIRILSAYPQICVSLFKIVLLCSRFFKALCRVRLNIVADKPSPCLTSLPMTKGALIFPSTFNFAWVHSSVIFTSLSICLGIPKLTSDSSSFVFGLCCQRHF
jgi:hypothetical protein